MDREPDLCNSLSLKIAAEIWPRCLCSFRARNRCTTGLAPFLPTKTTQKPRWLCQHVGILCWHKSCKKPDQTWEFPGFCPSPSATASAEGLRPSVVRAPVPASSTRAKEERKGTVLRTMVWFLVCSHIGPVSSPHVSDVLHLVSPSGRELVWMFLFRKIPWILRSCDGWRWLVHESWSLDC